MLWSNALINIWKTFLVHGTNKHHFKLSKACTKNDDSFNSRSSLSCKGISYPESLGFLVSGRSPRETLECWKFYCRNLAVTVLGFVTVNICEQSIKLQNNHIFPFTQGLSRWAPADQEPWVLWERDCLKGWSALSDSAARYRWVRFWFWRRSIGIWDFSFVCPLSLMDSRYLFVWTSFREGRNRLEIGRWESRTRSPVSSVDRASDF